MQFSQSYTCLSLFLSFLLPTIILNKYRSFPYLSFKSGKQPKEKVVSAGHFVVKINGPVSFSLQISFDARKEEDEEEEESLSLLSCPFFPPLLSSSFLETTLSLLSLLSLFCLCLLASSISIPCLLLSLFVLVAFGQASVTSNTSMTWLSSRSSWLKL